MSVPSSKAPLRDRRHVAPCPVALPVLAIELMDLDDFGRLVERHTRHSSRDGYSLSALTLRVHFEREPDAAFGLHGLAQCMRRLRHQMRATDTLARWQTTQFGVMLPRCTPLQAEAVLLRLTRFAADPCGLHEELPKLSVQGCVSKGQD